MLAVRMSGFVNDATLTEGVVGRRVLAAIVDALIMAVILTLLRTLLWLLGYLTLGLGWFLAGGLWVVPLAYVALFVASPGQATPGQAILGLRVVRDDDLGRPEPAQACLYAILYAVTMWAGVFWLLAALFTRRARCLHDIFSGLLVARADAVPCARPDIWTMADGQARP
jgi:uncharacterized RDD family membrane protein YckC